VEIMNYNVNNENERIIIGEVGENLAESCTIDYSAWVEEYGEGNLRIRAIREGDAEPYPVANVETADGVATWTYTAADTAVKGFGEVQVLYYVGDVLAKSRVWKTYTYRSLNTSSEEVPDPYADWLNAVERIGGQVEADAEAASASADSASASATLAAGSASEAAESALSASRSASAALGSASAASSSADSAASSASAASRSATEASNYEYYSEQYMNEAKSAKFGAESARTGAENAKAAAQASATAAAQSAAQAEEMAESIEASADLIQKLLANQIKDTATGTIATYPDGADMPMVSLVADIDPIQDTSGGAPSPSNICPISGWDSVDVSVAGKNLADSGHAWSINASGVIIANADYNCSIVSVKKGETFTHSINGAVANLPLVAYYESYPDIGSVSYDLSRTTNVNGRFVAPITGYAVIRDAKTSTNIQVELGSTATDYEPFVSSNTHTTTLPQTVYGGTLDVVSGVLTVDRAMVTLNTANMNNSNDYPGWSNSGIRNLMRAGLNTIFNDVQTNVGRGIGVNTVSTNDTLILSKSQYGLTQTQWKELAIDAQMLIPLATPTTIQLTPTQIDSLLGRNNVWSDSGVVTVEYIADTKLYIQKVIG
jgi:hypothetical protein